MKFQPLVSWWIIVTYAIVAAAASGWLIWPVRHKGRAILMRWLQRAALLLLPVLLAVGPSIHGGTSAPGVANLDVIFAIDTTPSMGAQDYAGTKLRLDGAKKDVAALAEKLQGAHLEIVTFDSDANVILPFTTDVSAFSAAVEGIVPQISSYSQGSAVDKPVELIAQEFKTSKMMHPDRKRLLFYLGDGEQTAGAPVGSFTPIAPYVNGGAVLGYGTTVGTKIIDYTNIYASGTASSYVTTVDPSTHKLIPAISKMDSNALQVIAKQVRIAYYSRNQGGPISSVYQASQAPLMIDHSQHIVHYLNLYWLLALPFAALFFWEWQALMINILELRKHRGGHRA